MNACQPKRIAIETTVAVRMRLLSGPTDSPFGGLGYGVDAAGVPRMAAQEASNRE
jgi:hypothetical protein